ncbi:MAG: glycosyltransferase [Microcystis aeruginosa Ma_QC_C_20070823_S13]|jgi:rSAM/selenodomain-associated transferase 2|uniref:4,4'-diaponeurosporenoate glycosyltransferase n=1 Tax=Microcystis aeruginosa G11-04 TaxID=2685956 RepID=A0A966G1S5_MICAE|nr:glycosyltransferase family 2 protein [Microcystis aeruginosa LE13-04]NCS58188.1 glycosyltransferase family 2 protein [Microcystis aeruginosa G11-04]NCT44738.1 glycosyltransferase family 2 protein [Microcystis aeruginosa G11-09]TRU58283.1 MAG: glycosyltransferase [Microcystis aeruginosa Ma_QC_C_20070823_S13D]TRU58991.1 MAG: glycosyltransferase [Microcystis aeruginosa Ma_QC_C_20070823_S13]
MNYLSIIIPTLNEELGIAATLKQIGAGVEIIVVDGGSTDKTREIAKKLGDKVIISPKKGRAFQMNLGAKIAKGDILLFLHGDTLLPHEFQEQIINTLSQSGIVAGAFELKIDGEEKTLRLVEKLVNWRSRWLSLPYGDQGIFLKAAIFADLGGFPELPIMEDFELIQRLKKRGKIAIVSASVITSARRWQKLGVWKTTLINQLVIIGYNLKIPPRLLKSFYRLWS